jgi:hypothetical protein
MFGNEAFFAVESEMRSVTGCGLSGRTDGARYANTIDY